MVLSHRRNKGLLIDVGDRITVRKLDLEFFNSGINDGIPSSAIRESVILRGRLKDHPNIVPLIQLSAPSSSQIRMVYPFVKKNLRQFLGEKPQPTEVIRDITHQLFRAIAFMHSKRVVHRNVRPENVLVDIHDGSDVLTIQLADWVSARTLAALSDRRCPLTPEEARNRPQTEKEKARLRYKAPELLLRLHTYGFPVDVWSAGVTVLEMIMQLDLPWNQCCSEQELLFSLFSAVGTPDTSEWPEGALCMALRCAPRFPRPDFAGIARRPDFVLSESKSFWERIKIHHGPQALLFLGQLLNPIPEKRPTANACLASSFVLGTGSDLTVEEIESVVSLHTGRPSSSVKIRYSRMDFIGGWLFRLSRLLDCTISKPIHLAVELFEGLSRNRPVNEFALLAACLKISIRFITSKDMFKQVNCSEIVSACADRSAISEQAIQEAEQFVINHIDSLVYHFDSTVIDVIEGIIASSKKIDQTIVYVSQYIADICLLDDHFPRSDIPLSDQAVAYIIIACQWLSKSSAVYLRDYDRSVDSLQVAVSACGQSFSETLPRIAIYDDGMLEKIIKWNYKSYLPKSNCPVWLTSRSYIESLLGTMDNTRRRSSIGTPPKPLLLLRRSTIEHAAQWAIESRRKKRHRSTTPIRTHKRVREQEVNENTAPSNFPITPRRSARLSSKQHT